MGVSDCIALLGGVALFLFGMAFMGENLKKVAGNRLELVLYRLSSTPLRGILLGAGVTAVIQSSSATSVMVVGFVNSGMMKVRQAIGVVLGAILGTSVTGWIVALSSLSGSGWVQLLSTATITGVVAVAGIILRMTGKKQSTVHLGDILLGFAVLMFGMTAMSGAVAPLRQDEGFLQMLTAFSNPLLGILAGIVITSVLQSASASIGILQALAVTGAVTFRTALPIVMGVAIGAAVPVLLSAPGAGSAGKRTAFAYLIIDVMGVIICGTVFYGLNAAVRFPFLSMTMTAGSIALVNTLFRLATVLALAPLIGAVERLTALVIPDAADQDAQDMDRLEDRFLLHPALALEQIRLVTNSMVQKAQKNLKDAVALRTAYSDKGFREVEDLESTIDRYEDKLGTYLMKVTGSALSDTQGEEVSKYFHIISDFERISDHALNLAESAREIHERQLHFSPEGEKEIRTLESAVTEVLRMATESFLSSSTDLAERVEPLEEVIDELCAEMKLRHVERLKRGGGTMLHSFVFNDLLTNYERVADHCSNVAVALIELRAETLDTHEYLQDIKARRDSTFIRYFDAYRQLYKL
ncbi:MAG: Na/Pi cotransporter family protein [Oscillospiraceae bacterium]|nr:Na/Pi cotransporter family protein [Oscillospiraceae bacterium]